MAVQSRLKGAMSGFFEPLFVAILVSFAAIVGLAFACAAAPHMMRWFCGGTAIFVVVVMLVGLHRSD